FSPDGTTLAAGGDGTVILFDVTTGKAMGHLAGGTSTVQTIVFSRDGRTLASSGSDGVVRLWEVASGQERRRYHGHGGQSVNSVALSSDGRTLASAGSRGETLLWD